MAAYQHKLIVDYKYIFLKMHTHTHTHNEYSRQQKAPESYRNILYVCKKFPLTQQTKYIVCPAVAMT